MANQILGDNTMVTLQRALDGLALRQQVISRNIANVDTPGYKASTVSFEQQLQHALRDDGGNPTPTRTSPGHLAAPASESASPRVTQRTNLTVRRDGNNVDIEREMTDLVETTLRYSATTRILNRKLALLRFVISEGQR